MERTEENRSVQATVIADIFLKHFIDNAATYTAVTLGLLTQEQLSESCLRVYEQMPTEKLLDLHAMLLGLKTPLEDVLKQREAT